LAIQQSSQAADSGNKTSHMLTTVRVHTSVIQTVIRYSLQLCIQIAGSVVSGLEDEFVWQQLSQLIAAV